MFKQFADLLDANVQHLAGILPEVVVGLAFLFGLLYDMTASESRRRMTGYVCLLGLLAALWVNAVEMSLYLRERPSPAQTAAAIGSRKVPMKVGVAVPVRGDDVPAIFRSEPLYSGLVAKDSFGTCVKFVLLLGTIVSLLMALHAKELQGANHGEFFLLMTATCLGGMFLCSSNNLLMIYLSIEALSVISYAIAGYLRQDRKSAEAGIKYVIYGAMASGIMVFGMSYLYGLTGTLNLRGTNGDGIVDKFWALGRDSAASGTQGALIAILGMIFCGFLYKIAAAPFHYWSPDVYEGAPTTATGFFSVVPKAAGFAVLMRVLIEFFPLGARFPSGLDYLSAEKAVLAVALLTMTIGNLAALSQNNAKRMLAYSSIAHAGYMLVGVALLDDSEGPAVVLFYLLAYFVMNLGAFLVLVALENLRGSCDLKDLRGVIRREPLLAVALVIFLFSLTGMPPLAGFTAKYLLMLKLAERQGWFTIMFVGANSVISLYYYMRLAKAVSMDPPDSAVVSVETSPAIFRFVAAVKVVALVALFVYFEPVMRVCRQVIEPLR